MKNVIRDITMDLSGKFACAIILIFFLIACFASVIAGDPSIIPEGSLFNKAPGYVIAESGQVMRFGTDQIGRDVWSGVIHGSRWALIVGFLATFISACIGVFFGVLAGYYGDTTMKLNRLSFLLGVLAWSVVSFYIAYFNWALHFKMLTWVLCTSIILYLISRSSQTYLSKYWSKAGYFFFPMDFIVLRIIEIWRAIPGLFILLAILVAVKHPTLWTVILVIGLLRWTRIARLVRAEFLNIRNLNYIRSAQSLGFSDFRIILKHGLPNAVSPLFVLFAFSISTAIILEATLSFLGIGVSIDNVTWGSLMSAARQNYRAWWLVLFPGTCIFLLVLSLNIIGDRLSHQT